MRGRAAAVLSVVVVLAAAAAVAGYVLLRDRSHDGASVQTAQSARGETTLAARVEKLTPRLVQVARHAGALAPSPTGTTPLSNVADNQPGGLERPDPTHVVVDVRVAGVGEATISHLADAGAKILATGDPRLKTVTVSVADVDLVKLAGVAEVTGVREVLTPQANG